MATVHENLIVVVLVDTDYGTSRLDGQRAQLGNKFKTDQMHQKFDDTREYSKTRVCVLPYQVRCTRTGF
jgi:hypothetical protein